MRGNQKARDRFSDDAQVGIGTMIVFIATVLVAAVAAGVLIQTSEKLQERSSRTGDQATRQVASNVNVERIIGERNDGNAATKITNMSIYIGLAPGASKVDLKQVQVQINTGTALKDIGFTDNANTPDSTGFSINEIRDEDNSIGAPATEPAVMNAGDLVFLKFNLDATGGLNLPLDVRKSISVQIYPEMGSPSHVEFTTPESFGADTKIDLR